MLGYFSSPGRCAPRATTAHRPRELARVSPLSDEYDGAISLLGASNLVYSGLHSGSWTGIGANQIDNGPPLPILPERGEMAGVDASSNAKTTEKLIREAVHRTGGGMA
jgi:hypothetical protein